MKIAEKLDNPSARETSSALIIADDLTGACDAGVQFARCGLSSVVEIAASGAIANADVRIANSRTRHESPEAAGESVTRLAQRMLRDDCAIYFKKVDSTLRGNIVAESQAMMRAAGIALAVLAPALPAQGRRVARGILNVHDFFGSSTLDVAKLLVRQGLANISLLSMQASASAIGIAEEIVRLHAAGAEFILCDSETDHDLERIANAIHQLPRLLPQRVLWIGSAGLAKYAAQILAGAPGRAVRPAGPKKIDLPHLRRADRRPAPTLFCVGSDHPVTLLQVRRLIESGVANALNAETSTPDEMGETIRQGRHALLLIYSANPDRERIALLIAEAKTAGISSAFLCGGNTAELVCDAISAVAIQLRDEVSAGVPWGIFRQGLLDGLPVATKAGGFGDEATLIDVAERLGTIQSSAR